MIKLKDILEENNTAGMGGGNNSARWTAPGQKRKINIPQLSGYEQVDFPTADSLDISNEPYHWESEGKSKKYHNKVRAVRGENGVLTLESIKLVDIISEVAYDGNLGFHEMFVFHSKATDAQVEKLENLIKRKRFKEAWKFVQKVTGMALKGAAFENTMLEAIANTYSLDIDDVTQSYQRGIKEEGNGNNLKVLENLIENPKKY